MAGQVKVKLRKNDMVQVISGKDRGQDRAHLRIDRETGRAVVDGLEHGEEGREAEEADRQGRHHLGGGSARAVEADDRVQEVRSDADRLDARGGRDRGSAQVRGEL